MKSFPEILKEKRSYYGNTEAAIEFAAEEYARQLIPTKKEGKTAGLEYSKWENYDGHIHFDLIKEGHFREGVK
jgi:hypothetical protein